MERIGEKMGGNWGEGYIINKNAKKIKKNKDMKSIKFWFLEVRGRLALALAGLMLMWAGAEAQPIPSEDENIPYLVTFGGQSKPEWGDDNNLQIIFFAIPTDFNNPVYIRVFDPDICGKHDELNGTWNTRTRFTVYGGLNSCSNKDAQKGNVDGEYDSGTMLATKTFGADAQYDDKWYTFGPFNPSEGENLPEFGGRIFKLVIEGVTGDDGNMYRLFLSRSATENLKIEGGFGYYFKYKFRMWDTATEVSHIYPYIDNRVIYIKQANFDWDNDGMIRVISVAKNGVPMKVSGDNVWAESQLPIVEAEKGTSWDIQMVKNKSNPLKNNNVVIYLENQYGELLPFYSVPIGGIPKYKYTIGVKPKK